LNFIGVSAVKQTNVTTKVDWSLEV